VSSVSSTSGVDLPVPSRVLAIGAHSDDVEFGCGATLAKWADHGTDISLLVLTDGSKGTWDPHADLPVLVETRRQEQKAAAAALGLSSVVFLDFVDGDLASGLSERAAVCEVIRRTRPQLVLGHDPWKRYRLHPDHRHAGWLTLDAVVAARDHHFFPDQGVDPHRPDQLLLFEAEVEDHYELVDGYLDAKVEALLCHRSQWRSTMGIDDDPNVEEQRATFEARIVDEARSVGQAAGLTGPAEAFKVIREV
jgi:LmbE family N-acetylglucosaminyl deacetylase